MSTIKAGKIQPPNDSDSLQIFTNTVERMRVTSGGLVGIGTASPSAPLHVSGLAAEIRITTPGIVGADFAIFPQTLPGSLGTPLFRIFDRYNYLDRLTISSDGLVGIGTSSPTAKLHIVGGQAEAFRLTAGTTGDVGLRVYEDADTAGFLRFRPPSATQKGFVFSDDGDSAILNINTLSSRVGIGTVSPASPLHISAAPDQLLLLEGMGPSSYMRFTSDSLNRGYFGHFDSAAQKGMYLINQRAASDLDSSLHLGTADSVKLIITGNGNVGIGTTGPAVALDVVGDVNATSFVGPLTGNATSATTAAACSGNSATATLATDVTRLPFGATDAGIGMRVFGSEIWLPNVSNGGATFVSRRKSHTNHHLELSVTFTSTWETVVSIKVVGGGTWYIEDFTLTVGAFDSDVNGSKYNLIAVIPDVASCGILPVWKANTVSGANVIGPSFPSLINVIQLKTISAVAGFTDLDPNAFSSSSFKIIIPNTYFAQNVSTLISGPLLKYSMVRIA